MPLIRRTRYLVFTCQDGVFLDIPALLRGDARTVPVRNTYALSILRGAEYPVASDELEYLLSLPSDRWVDSDGADHQMLGRLAERGLVLVDDDAGPFAENLRRDSRLEAGQWNLYGALYHFLTKWRDVDLAGPADDVEGTELPPLLVEAIDAFLKTHGPPPPAFHDIAAPRAVLELPLIERNGGLYDALAMRRTTRSFDVEATMTIDDLATVLYYAAGCHGYAGMARGELMIKRTSPSAGGLHPIEIYPLVARVEGLPSGLYHYNARDHSLELLRALDSHETDATAREFVCGQGYFASAHVLFAMTARFYRSFWKYRRHQRAYAVLMMDAAHISQTLYLVAAELGLGAFFTAAINGANIEDRLGIDGWTEGALAVSGCGVPSREGTLLEPTFTRYVPRETQLP
jgi:putative peptide maturation dehydrogenase